ncbi:MAG TPA: sulfite exporter TauE/SafE family protein [Candidatus Brocadiia bacterium]|nr:sulfite exporter TauE/SafE family protein [Candidatus Brocadiia bacterium]
MVHIAVGGQSFFIGWIILSGLAAGLGSGLFGIGGAVILTPLLHSLLGLPLPVVIGTGLCQMIAASASGVMRFRKSGVVDYQVALMAAGGNLAGVTVGVAISEALENMPQVTFHGRSAPLDRVAITGLFIAALVLIGTLILLEKPRGDNPPPPGRFLAALRRIPPRARLVRTGGEASIPLLVFPTVLVGLVSGMLGIGGSVFVVPLLIYGVGLPTHVAIATSLLYALFTGVFGTIEKAITGDVMLSLAILIMIGSTVGSQIGAILAMRTRARRLRKAFGVLLFVSAVMMAWKLCSRFV